MENQEPTAPTNAKEICVCPYVDEVGAIRSWRRLYPALLGVVFTLASGVAVHSCTVSREAGEIESEITHLELEVRDGALERAKLRQASSSVERETSRADAQIMIQLGRVEEKIDAVVSRLDRIEARQESSSMRRRPQ